MELKIFLNPSTHNQPPSSAQTVLSNEDLLIGIFLHIPIGSLIGFKLVSKQWYSIKTLLPQFRKVKFTAGPFSSQNRIDVLQFCNGLLLCCSSYVPPCCFICKNSQKSYYICNPTTKKFFLLPKASWFGMMSLASDPAKSPHYNVVRFSRPKCIPGSRDEIWVYTSKIGFCWKIEDSTDQIASENMVYCNLGSHYFNVDQETIHSMQMPPPHWDNGYIRNGNCLVEWCDHLYYVQIFSQPILFHVYEMKRDHSEWFIRYHVNLSSIMDAYPEMILDHLHPIYNFCTMVRGDEHEDDSFLILLIPGKLIRYSFVKNTYETIFELLDAIRSFEV